MTLYLVKMTYKPKGPGYIVICVMYYTEMRI